MAETILLVFLAMAFKDVASNASVYLVSKGHGLWAGLADGLSDIATVFSIGITAVVSTSHGFSTETVLALTALFFGSIVGGVAGTRLGHKVSDKLEDDSGSTR